MNSEESTVGISAFGVEHTVSKGLFPGPLGMAEQAAFKAKPKKTVREMLAAKDKIAKPSTAKPYKKPTPTAHDLRRSFGL